MSDTPIADAVRDLPKNELLIEGEASKEGGAGAHVQLEREKNGKAIGVEAGINQKKGWSVGGFFKWVWK